MLICDDHPTLTDGLSMVLLASGFDAVHVVATAAAALDWVRDVGRPDVVLMDYQLPDVDGVTAVRQLKKLDPAVRIVVLTATTDERVAARALEAGAEGFLTKHKPTSELISAIRAAMTGEVVVSSDMFPKVMAQLGMRSHQDGWELTEREVQVLELMATGLSNDEIGSRLYISRNTVRSHVQHVLQKLGAHSRLEGVLIANRAGLLSGV